MHCNKIFKKKYNLEPAENKKAKNKLLTSIEKCKKILSANLEGVINVECLMEDEDINVTIKRIVFEEICNDTFEKIRDVCNRFYHRLLSNNKK